MRGSNRKVERNAELMRLHGLGWPQRRIAAHSGLSQVRVGMIISDETFRARREHARSSHAQPQ